MAEGECLHAYGAVIVDDVGAAMGEGVELDAVAHALAEEVELWAHQLLQFGKAVYVQGGCSSQKAERRDESNQPEAVVAVEVRDEDVVEPREIELCTAELLLCTFAAVNHVELFAQVDDLRCGVVACGGECRAAAEDMDVEPFHVCLQKFRSRFSPFGR